jgi:hypothetical protein
MGLTNFQVAQRFVQGRAGKSKSMSTDGTTLYSYSTGIAKRMRNGEIVVNTTKYSRTTGSKHYPALRSAISHENIKNVSYTGGKDYGYDYRDFDDDDFTQDNDDKFKKHLKK